MITYQKNYKNYKNYIKTIKSLRINIRTGSVP